MLEHEKNTPCYFTQQLFLIGTRNEDGAAHFAPISWVSYTGGEPACLVISMAGSKKTKENVARTGMLSATVVTPELLPFAERNNAATRGDTADCAVQPLDGSLLDVPLIKNAVFSYECTIHHTVQLGDTTTYFAAIQHVNCREDIERLDFYDLRQINPVIYSPYNYFTVGEHLGAIGDYYKK